MDFCLRGSQINLVARQKPKPKFSSQSNLHLVPANSHFLSRSRPRSANYLHRRSRSSSSFLYRPQSADPKFERALGSAGSHYIPYNENDFQASLRLHNHTHNKNLHKRFQSVSSSNLLKILLDEPIKRSWLCRSAGAGGGGSSPDDQSELSSTSRKTSSYSSLLQNRIRTESAGGSSGEGDAFFENFQRANYPCCNQQRKGSASSSGFASKHSTISTMSSLQKSKASTTSNEYWLHSSASVTPENVSGSSTSYNTSLISKSMKPDLPGRVSFCKTSNAQNDIDSSDCDNDKQDQFNNYESQTREAVTAGTATATTTTTLAASTSTLTSTPTPTPTPTPTNDNSISAPGPAKSLHYNFERKLESGLSTNTTLTNTTTNTTESSGGTSSGHLKKTVHFGSGDGSTEEVLAETYEYPKCPSENCSCSTRSSSTASIHDVLDGRCACETETCKYVLENANSNGKRRSSLPNLANELKSSDEIALNCAGMQVAYDESPVIREYKQAVGDQVDNSVVKNILKDKCPFKMKRSNSNLGPTTEGLAQLDKYKSPEEIVQGSFFEKQNNLSETKSSTTAFKANSKRNLIPSIGTPTMNAGSPSIEYSAASASEALALDGGNLMASKVSYTSSSESVINNYLKVAASTSTPSALLSSKKKEKPTSADAVATRTQKATKSMNSTKASGADSSKCSKLKVKKSTSYGCLREDSNLEQFHLDKVDSWMSMMQQQNETDRNLLPPENQHTGSMIKHSSLDGEMGQVPEQHFSRSLDSDNREDADEVESSSQASTKSDDNSAEDSTYDEIVSVIKEIEEDKKKDNLAERAVSEMELKLSTPSELSESAHPTNGSNDGNEEPDKYKDILNYLDNVEDSCDKTLLETRRSMPESNRSEIEFVVEPDIAEDVPKLADLLLLPNHQLARRVVALSLRANELANAVVLSKEHLSKLRLEKQKSVRAEKANSTNRLREQKKHYETIVKRHQGFIEQLLKDKGSLCEKVAALTRRLESQNQAWEHKLETEITKVKETMMAGEKIRRERWVRENTKKIKELTVKGLENEINRMTCEHQRAVSELKRDHQQQLLNALEEARVKHEQAENAIRETCAQDRESLIEKERGAIRERFERQLEEERKSCDEQKQKLCEEFAAERERLQSALKAKEHEYQTKRQELAREKEKELEQAIADLQEKMSKQDEKYQNRINTIEKQYEADFEIWKKEYENNCKLAQVEKENSIRQHYRAERDRQIDAIVSRMDAEALKNAEEFEAKLSRFKEKYERDLEEAETMEKSLREKYTETRSKLAESDAQVRNCQAELKQLQIELEHSKKMCNDFLGERDQLRDNVRNEMQSEVAALKLERDNEIQKIHKRVQQAIEKKDATIEILQKENGALRERCVKLEAIIRQQRKDYCVK